MKSAKKSRATLIGVVLAFLIPVIGAKLVLDQTWYQGAVTNKGIMLVPPIELQDLNQSLPEGWVIALIDDGQCGIDCEQALYAINQTDVALGKETERVTPVLISAAPSTLNLSNTPQVTAVVNPDLVQRLSEIPQHHLFIVDPLGNVMLHYPTYANEEQMRAEAKNLLADLRTMLKLSKIG